MNQNLLGGIKADENIPDFMCFQSNFIIEKLLFLHITSAQALDVFVGQRCVQLFHVLRGERKDLSSSYSVVCREG